MPHRVAHSATRRRLLQALAATPLVAATQGHAAPNTKAAGGIDILEAINQAGRQRMLSQRMAKLYAQQIRQVRETDARKLLADSMALFEKQLGNLHQFASASGSANVLRTYDNLRTQWLDYKSVVGGPVSATGLQQVAQINERVLATAHEGTVQLENLHGGSFGKLVNLAGRQRMLSQRMSKFYFFRACGITSPDITKGLEGARSEFLTAMRTLKNAPENTNDISSWIALGETQWMFFDDAVRAESQRPGDKLYHDNNVAVTSENLLQVMDKVTGLYAALS